MWTIPALIAVFVRTPPRTFLNDLMKVDIALSTDNRKHPKRLFWLMKRGKVARLNLLAMMEWLDVAGSRLQFAILKSYFQCLQAPLIFLGCADGNTDPFRQLIAAHRSHNHALLLHRLKHALAFADAHQNEIGGRRNVFEFQIAECAIEKVQAARIVLARLVHVFRRRPARRARRLARWN